MSDTNGNGSKPKRKPRPQSEIELMTMRNAAALLARAGLTLAGRRRVVQYLSLAIEADMEPADVDPPNQLKVPGTEEQELPFE